jgi:hypothetical protein
MITNGVKISTDIGKMKYDEYFEKAFVILFFW